MEQFVRRVCTSFEYSVLWLLCRLRPATLLVDLVPYAYAFSALANLAFLAVSYGGVLFLIKDRLGPLAFFAMLAMLGCHRVFGSQRFAMAVAVLIAMIGRARPDTIGLSALNVLFAFAFHFERRLATNQFRFKPFYTDNVNQGSASVLRGEVHVVHVFVQDEVPWVEHDACISVTAAKKSLDWLVRQAKSRKVNLAFVEHFLWAPYDIAVPQSRSAESTHIHFANWLKEVVSRDLKNFHNLQNEKSFALVHASEALEGSWGYAVPRRFLGEMQHSLEYAIVGTPPSQFVYAHEILHLFGADDFYMAAYAREEHEVRRSLLRQCIMFGDTDQEIDSSIVDDLTAQNVGWM